MMLNNREWIQTWLAIYMHRVTAPFTIAHAQCVSNIACRHVQRLSVTSAEPEFLFFFWYLIDRREVVLLSQMTSL
jgi:hypothetical protein